MDNQFMSVPEAGKALGVGPARAYELAAAAVLPTIRVGRRLLVPRAAFETWLKDQSLKALQSVKEPSGA